MNQTIYAIVVTYNGSKWVNKCFGSLVNSSIPLKILAIDNASTDGTPDIIRKKFPQVEVIETGENLGFGKANNIGLKRVVDENADYAFLLNQDAWVEKDTIEKLVEVHQAHPDFGLLSPVPYDGNQSNLDYLYAQYYQDGIDLQNEYTNKTYEIEFINAAGWLLANKLVKQVGGFHPKFLMHGEDKNYVDRIHFIGSIKIGITLNSKYFHDRQNRSEIENTYKKILYAQKSKIKTDFYNPNRNMIPTLFNQIKVQTIMLLKSQYSLRQYYQLFTFSILYFFKAIPYRKIYFKP